MPVELLHFTEAKPVVQEVTVQEAAAAAEAIKRGDSTAADEEMDRLSRAVTGDNKRCARVRRGFECWKPLGPWRLYG